MRLNVEIMTMHNIVMVHILILIFKANMNILYHIKIGSVGEVSFKEYCNATNQCNAQNNSQEYTPKYMFLVNMYFTTQKISFYIL